MEKDNRYDFDLEFRSKKPTLKQVFDAMTDDSDPDWSADILDRANPDLRKKVIDVFRRDLTESEAADYLDITD